MGDISDHYAMNFHVQAQAMANQLYSEMSIKAMNINEPEPNCGRRKKLPSLAKRLSTEQLVEELIERCGDIVLPLRDELLISGMLKEKK